jgi:hypothetical protein
MLAMGRLGSSRDSGSGIRTLTPAGANLAPLGRGPVF